MMHLVPKARSELFPIISGRFPFWKTERSVLTWYCFQSFQALEYLPSIRKPLLEVVIDKCLEIDVNITINEDGEVSIEEHRAGNVLNTDGDPTREDEKEGQSQSTSVDALSDTLDSILSLFFRKLKDGSEASRETRDLYYEILPVFESAIITTHKSKFVQYCIFLLCGLESDRTNKAHSDEANPDTQHHSVLHRDFASKLLELIMDPYRATLTRQSAACYLASFVSRASYVESETVCESTSALLRWAEAYIKTLASDAVRATDSREQSDLHSLFYTVCQAAFYIMCFRGTDAINFYRQAVAQRHEQKANGTNGGVLLPDPEDIDLGTARWTNVCNHDLQPLRFCLESVRSEFLHVTHAFGLIEEQVLDKLVHDAKRMSTGSVDKKAASSITTAATLEKQRRTGGVGGLGRGSNPLKSFFPFDPLLLRRSHAFIKPFYKHWQGPVEEQDLLVIDEAPNDVGEMFEMDEDQQLAEEWDEQDDAPVVVSDQDAKDEDSGDDDDSSHLDIARTRQHQKEMWAESLKRPRSQSMENGSW